MREFVEECRREWKRLGVPAPVANEMAADLSADLDEAEAEGHSAEEVLGTAAFDPREFAARWAAERGVAQVPRPRLRRRVLLGIAVVAGAVAVAFLGRGLVESSREQSDPSGVATVSAPVTTAVTTVIVPNLLGLREDEATALGQEVGLRIRISHRDRIQATAAVVEQSPQPGTEVSPGAVLSLVVGR